jgi:large subunit ribosomal protein L6
MSRIGRAPIELIKGVEIKIEGDKIIVKGPKGTLTKNLPAGISFKVEGNVINVTRSQEDNSARSLHGLFRMLINNMIIGVSKGFEKRLELSGVGYRAAKQGTKLSLQVGFSHPVVIDPPAGIEIKVEGTDKIVVSGADKELVGLVAADIRSTRKVEPYKLKGIKYAGEFIKKKAGKAAKAAGAGAK